MGWINSHLYEFRIGGAGWGEPDPDGIYDGPMDAKKGRLAAVLADAGRKTFSYIYDFGDGWDHTVKLEKIAPAIDGEPTFLLSSKPLAAARPKTAAARQATRDCWRSSPIPTTRSTPKRSPGAAVRLIRSAPISRRSKPQSSSSLAAGVRARTPRQSAGMINGHSRTLTLIPTAIAENVVWRLGYNGMQIGLDSLSRCRRLAAVPGRSRYGGMGRSGRPRNKLPPCQFDPSRDLAVGSAPRANDLERRPVAWGRHIRIL